MVLPLVKVEVEEDRTTKGAKKGGAASKKKKGGKQLSLFEQLNCFNMK